MSAFVQTIVLVAVAGLPVVAADAPLAQATLEYKVKAAYLLNFTRYVDWPEWTFAAPDSPIQICILGADPFGAVLEKTMAGRSSKGRPIEVLRASQLDERLISCHIVFLSHSEFQQLGARLAKLEHKPVLTVGESPDFLRDGGIINFVIVHNQVHFEVNIGAAERAGLKLSSRMMPLANRVISNGGKVK